MTDDLKRILAKRIREFRLSKGYTQIELAKKLGMGPSSISNIENCRRNVTFETVERIATELGVKPTDLVNVKPNERDLPEIVAEVAGKYPAMPDTMISIYQDIFKHGIFFKNAEDYYYLWLIVETLRNDKKGDRGN